MIYGSDRFYGEILPAHSVPETATDVEETIETGSDTIFNTETGTEVSFTTE